MTRANTLGVAGVLLWAGVSLGCRRAASEAPDEASPDTVDTVGTVGTLDPGEAETCRPGARFVDYAWVPDDAHLTTSIQRKDPQLPGALTTIARMTEAPEVSLPVVVALDFRNLSLQLGNLDRVLAELGDDPAELVELHSPVGEVVWLWPSDCPPALLAARVLDRWQIMLRADLEHPGLRFGAGSAEGFPFDVITVVTLTEQRVGLTRVGRGAAVVTWLRESARGGEHGPGLALAELDPAPLRSVIGGASSLTTNDSAAALDPNRDPNHHRVRVTSSGWDTGEH